MHVYVIYVTDEKNHTLYLDELYARFRKWKPRQNNILYKSVIFYYIFKIEYLISTVFLLPDVILVLNKL